MSPYSGWNNDGNTIRIRQGHAGNGHYIRYYWSVERDKPDGGRELVSGSASTWEQAFAEAAEAKEQKGR